MLVGQHSTIPSCNTVGLKKNTVAFGLWVEDCILIVIWWLENNEFKKYLNEKSVWWHKHLEISRVATLKSCQEFFFLTIFFWHSVTWPCNILLELLLWHLALVVSLTSRMIYINVWQRESWHFSRARSVWLIPRWIWNSCLPQ